MALKLALRSITRNKMRSFLTMLGIIIGVAAVIAMVAVGQGATSAVESQMASLGTNMLIIMPGTTTQGGIRGGSGSSTRLTPEDANAIQAECSAVKYISPSIRTVAQVVASGQNWSTAIQGGTPNFFKIRNWNASQGSIFDWSEEIGARNVCLLGQIAAQNLFGSQNPVGQTVRIKNIPFRVIGVLSLKGQSAMGQDQDDVVVLPFSTVQRKILGVTHAGIILMSATSPETVDLARSQARDVLRQRHRLLSEKDDDFTIRSLTEIASQAEAASRIMSILLGSIASISLLVGGIGIMNIMLVSVTERTKEIGIRMAIGARQLDILWQFLTESLVISTIGGLIGIMLGIGVAFILSNLASWPTLISALGVGGAFLFSLIVGVVFGIYPAWKASHLDPINALRYE